MEDPFARYEQEIVPAEGEDAAGLELHTAADGEDRTFRLVNASPRPKRVREAVVLRCPMPWPGDTPFYAEGSSMLAQYWGTPDHIETTSFADRDHYRFPGKDGFFTVYNLIHFFPGGSAPALAGFASCRRFANAIRFNRETIEFAVDCEGVAVPPGGVLELEDLFATRRGGREDQLAALAARLARRHPPRPHDGPLTGWCSWYAYGPDAAAGDIERNAAAMKARLPGFRYVQLDDGHQARMGDWLTPHARFPDGVEAVCRKIRAMGLEPAIWVAPFIAEAESDLFRQHPDWFVQDEAGGPLSSARDSFGGWRAGPWYMLDGSHPDARDYLRRVFRAMREAWGCRYFKLDALQWGCMPFGRRHDTTLTRVESYRAGMAALAEGAGADAVILGCNAPMWPSLGTCTAMRTTGDIARHWTTFRATARECFSRNWMNGRLWRNDPDCLVLQAPDAGPPPPGGPGAEESGFHRAHLLASGGALLSGDRLTGLSDDSFRLLRRLAETRAPAARFDDPDFRHGTIRLDGSVLHCFFNWQETGRVWRRLPTGGTLTDYWTDAPIAGERLAMPPRSARVVRQRGT